MTEKTNDLTQEEISGGFLGGLLIIVGISFFCSICTIISLLFFPT